MVAGATGIGDDDRDEAVVGAVPNGGLDPDLQLGGQRHVPGEEDPEPGPAGGVEHLPPCTTPWDSAHAGA
jgi:hypothetical protein